MGPEGSSSLGGWITRLRRAGDPAGALELARRLRRERDVDPDAAAWSRADARRQVETLEAVVALPGTDRAALSEADALDEERDAAVAAGDLAAAAAIAERQWRTRSRLLGPQHPETGAALEALALATGDPERHREAIAILRAAWSDHPDLADALDALARLLLERGLNDEVDRLALDAYEMRLRMFGPEHADVATSLLTRARVELRRQDREAGERFSVEALAMRRRLFGDEDLAVAEALQAMGDVANGHDWGAAERYTREALEMRRRIVGDDHPLVEQSLVSLAEIVRWVGEPAEARDILRDVAAMQERARGPEDLGLAQTLNNLALAHRFLREYDAARPLLERSAAIYAALAGEDHPATLTVQANLALNHAYRGDFDGATAILDRCRELATRMALAHGRPPTLGLYDNYQSRVEELRGDPAAAERYLLRGLEDHGGELPEDGTAGATSFNLKLGTLRAARGDLAGAQENLERASRCFEGARRLAGGGLQPATFQQTPYERLALVLLERGKPREAWDALERARSRVLDDLLVGRSGDPVPFALERVQASLPATTALVGWLDFDLARGMPRYWAYVIRSSGPVRWVRLPAAVGIEEMADRLRRFRDGLGAPSPLGRRDDFRRDEARALWEERFRPLQEHLGGVRELILIPSWVMGGFPVGVLVSDGDEFLGDRYDISYAPSATVRTLLRDAGARVGRPPRTALLVGDPPFTEAQVAGAEAIPATEPAQGSPPVDGAVLRSAIRGDVRAASRLPRLSWSRQEVTMAAREFPASTLLVGPRASEREVATLAERDELRGYDVVHIATHALIDNEKPERSGLVLSQVGNESRPQGTIAHGPDRDGIISGSEILAGWELDAELVTLSACQTALGRNVYGEGVVGLSYPFLKAGARGLLVSLWKVDDHATALLMGRFYQSWLADRDDAGRPRRTKAQALAEAKRWLRDYRDDEGRQPYRHPYYWSAFVLIGDGS